jgi:hypothetical protein
MRVSDSFGASGIRGQLLDSSSCGFGMHLAVWQAKSQEAQGVVFNRLRFMRSWWLGWQDSLTNLAGDTMRVPAQNGLMSLT